MKHMLPHGISDILIRQFTQDLLNCMDSQSDDKLVTVIEFYKAKMVLSQDDYSKWHKVELFVRVLQSLNGEEQILRYLSVMDSVVHENLSQRNTKHMFNYLNNDSLNSHNHVMTPLRSGSVYAESFENLDKFSEKRSEISSPPNRRLMNSIHDISLSNLSDPYYGNMIHEQEVLKNISFTLLATTSKLFPIQDHQIYIPPNIPNGESGILHQIFEVALLYQVLSNEVGRYNTLLSLSPLKMSFLTVVSEELGDYTKIINNLFVDISKITLRSLSLSVFEQTLKFRFLCNYMSNFEAKRGDQLLSEFNCLRKHGDPLINKLASISFRKLIFLYNELLILWLTKGQLRSNDEFFVTSVKDNQTHELNIKLINKKIPDFVPLNVANQIYIIGKTYLFLEIYCKDIQWINNHSNVYFSKYHSLDKHGVSQEFFSIIEYQYIEINKRVNEVLREKFFYKETINLLKNLLLIGRGDFIEIIINQASTFFMEPVNSLPSYQLTKALQDSIQQCSLRHMINKYDNNFVISKVDARVLELGHGPIGWDVFTLDYLVETPLSLVLNVNRLHGKKEYLRIFNFLWRIKKNNYFFQEGWLQNVSLVRDFKKIQRNRPLVSDILRKITKVNILKNQIQQLSKKLEFYCFYNIIEVNYQELENKLLMNENSPSDNFKITTLKNGIRVIDGILKPPNFVLLNVKNNFVPNAGLKKYTIDELESLHNTYLSNILNHKLLDSQNDKISGKVTGQFYSYTLIMLFNGMYEFGVLYFEFNRIIHEILIQMSLGNQLNLNNQLSRFNFIMNNLVRRFKEIYDNSHAFIKDLKMDGTEDMAKMSKMLR